MSTSSDNSEFYNHNDDNGANFKTGDNTNY